MQIDQRHVTTVNLNDGRARDFVLLQDGRGFRLSCVSREDVVHVLLSSQDLNKLRAELGKTDVKDVKREPRLVSEVREPAVAGPETYHFQWSTLDWLSFN